MKRVGILGGGQLGKMLLQAASPFPIIPYVLDRSENVPCYPYCQNFVKGSVDSEDDVYQFGKHLDVITIEFEHVNTQALYRLEKEGVQIYPQPRILEIIRDKGLQKRFWEEKGLPSSPFKLVENAHDMAQYPEFFPVVQKIRCGGYDGKGVKKLASPSALHQALSGPSVMEKEVNIAYELSVIVARNTHNETIVYPPSLMRFEDKANVLDVLICPAPVSSDILKKVEKIALDVVNALEIVGVLAVECFVTPEGTVLVNEVAPRPHNSGHHTIEASVTSQYTQHLRAILGLPLGAVEMHCPSAVMINILGPEHVFGPYKLAHVEEVMATTGVFFHWYGKQTTSPYRKLGHITVCENNNDVAIAKARHAQNTIRIINHDNTTP